MLQRLIYSVLKSGIQAAVNDPAILEELFGDELLLSDTEVAAIKTFFQTPPDVIHGYARHDAHFPIYAVVLADESEDELVTADEAGVVDDGDDFGADVLESIWAHTFMVLCYAEHPDVTTYMYDLAKYIFMLGRRYLVNHEEAGITTVQFSGGDLAPDPRYLPQHLFLRQLTIKMGSEFARVDHESRLGKAFKVSGIHIDSSGSPSDVGGVQTLVTPYTLGDDDEG
jgi:hypothetical protein